VAVGEILRPQHPTPRPLSELAHRLGLHHQGPDAQVSGVAVHTGFVVAGDIFVAMQGASGHGIDFWPQAARAGAIAVFTDEQGASAIADPSVPVLIAPTPRALLGSLAAIVYGTAEGDQAKIFAVTGTNGKTSTAFLLDALMQALGWVTALSTTAERHVAGHSYASTLTTPEAPDIHAMLALAKEKKASGVALEVSAQALEKNRLDQVIADVAGFTNLSHDHFEDFGNMDNYLAAKSVLFTPDRARQGVVCIDSSYGEKLVDRATIPIWTIASSGHPRAQWTYRVMQERTVDTTFLVSGPEGESLEVVAPIIGSHMVANAALAIVMLLAAGVPFAEMVRAIGPGTSGIPVFLPGRSERVSGEGGPLVFVDAGRSEDAYRATLAALRQRTQGKLVMVCGTSGNRDASKRPLMGMAAAQLADVVIITDDDPRREDPHEIRAGLLAGARSVPGSVVHEIADPSAAIRFALSLVGEGDTVVWSGPGSQSYRDIGGVKVPYSARNEARAALNEAGWPHEMASNV